MRAYLVVSTVSGQPVPPHVHRAAGPAAELSVPVPKGDLRTTIWEAPDRATVLCAWSNEPDHELLPPPLHTSATGQALGYCGYLGDQRRDPDRLLATADLGAAAAPLGGVFALFRSTPDGFEAATSIARVCPVYYAESGDVRVAGSRALLVHLVARAAATGESRPDPEYDVPALQPLIRHGFFLNDETPFRGVRALPPASVLTARRGERLRVVAGALPEAEPGRDLSALHAALVAAAAPLARHDEPVTLALSGGRDSRLLAAVLYAADVPMVARTHGMADDPDVLLARRIAETLGIEHRVDLTVPEEGKVSVPHPFVRTHNVIRLAEGMTSAYEGIQQYRGFVTVPNTSGSGGETLRGGFLYDQRDIGSKDLQQRVRTLFKSAHRLMTPSANARAQAECDIWEERAAIDGFRTLDHLYLLYRTGRWTVGSHTATLMNSVYYHPFFDNRVVRAALAVSPRWRWTERPVHDLIKSMAPSLIKVPLEKDGWRFERRGPLGRLRSTGSRRPVSRPGFNWRLRFGPDYRALLGEQIMEGPQELFEIADRTAVSRLVTGETPGWIHQLWHLYTVSVLLSDTWRAPVPDLPSQTVASPGHG